MLFSIVVLSYNRPKQIERILKKISSVKYCDFNLIIKDDCSPKLNEIQKIVEFYAEIVEFDISLYKNESNLGYDGNLLDAFNVTNAEYLFLLSDDDYIDGEGVLNLARVLEKRQYKIYFTPYRSGDVVNRIADSGYKFDKFNDVIYNSILFSGLIFDRVAVLDIEKDENFLLNCIYSQVYLASMLVYKYKGFGCMPSNVLHLGGDGENYFGKNESAVDSELLTDRSEVTSNYKYQTLLLKVIERISLDSDRRIIKIFEKEYNFRLIGYLFRARSLGLCDYKKLIFEIDRNKYKTSYFVNVIIVLLRFIPAYIAMLVYDYFVRNFKKSG